MDPGGSGWGCPLATYYTGGQEALLWPYLYFSMPIYTKKDNFQKEKWSILHLKAARSWIVIKIKGHADLPCGMDE